MYEQLHCTVCILMHAQLNKLSVYTHILQKHTDVLTHKQCPWELD